MNPTIFEKLFFYRYVQKLKTILLCSLVSLSFLNAESISCKKNPIASVEKTHNNMLDQSGFIKAIGNFSNITSDKKVYEELPSPKHAAAITAWLTVESATLYNATEDIREDLLGKYLQNVRDFMQKHPNLRFYGPYDVYSWHVLDASSKNLIGRYTIDTFNTVFKTAYIHYSVSHKEYRKGYGTIIMARILRRSFDEMNLFKVYATVVVENVASIKIFEKFGFKREGFLRKDHVVATGKRADVILYAMLRSEWNEFKKKYHVSFGD